MQTFEAKILSILELQPNRLKDHPNGQKDESGHKVWQMRVSYQGPQSLYEMELREPLKSSASKRHIVGLNGFVEFELLSNPQVSAGDHILIDAFEPGEKLLG